MVIDTAYFLENPAARSEAVFYTALRNTTLDILTGLAGYESWPLETKNAVYDLLKKDILKALNK